MTTRVFDIDELDDLTTDPVLQVGLGARRWSESVETVFKADDDKLYMAITEHGLTEYQDFYGEEQYPDAVHDPDTGVWSVTCPEVELYEEMQPVKRWRKVDASD